MQSGAAVTITGTATDTGGGVVGGVEVSTDGGTTWHPATGRGTWTYTWTPGRRGHRRRSRPGPPTTAPTSAPPRRSSSPSAAAVLPVQHLGLRRHPGDRRPTPTPAAIEVGVKFRSDVAGTGHRLRFYKGSGNTGTHVGHLWTATGTLLGTVTFTGETATGWQQANLRRPGAR